MYRKASKLTNYIKIAVGVFLIGYTYYSIYVSTIIMEPLDVISFMIKCILIISIGYSIVLLYDCLINKKRRSQMIAVAKRAAIEGITIIGIIVIICSIINIVVKN